MMVLLNLIAVLLVLPTVLGAKILGIVPTPSHSHQIAFMPFWKELSLRGHNVTVLTTDPQNDPDLTNLKEIDLKFTYMYMANITKVAQKMNMWNTLDIFSDILADVNTAIYERGIIQALIKNNKNFDVVFVEGFVPQFLYLAKLYNCPSIMIFSLDALSFMHRFFGNPSHPALNPEMITSLHGNLNFKERLISFLFDLYGSTSLKTNFFRKQSAFIRKYFKTEVTAEELVSNLDMMFLNVNPVIQNVRALGPSTINIGGYERKTSLKSPPKDLKKFLDGAKEGFVYFSLGSNVKSKDLKPETLAAIIETLQSLPYKILWKFEADELPGKPNNVKLVKWAPQQSVLAHPNIKLFVTQGGLQSMEEAIYSEVPMVVMPFFGDQEQNAKLMKSKGIAIIVEVRPYLNKDELKTAMLEVLKNPKYSNSVKRLKQLAMDTPMTGLEKAVWWTEYVIRNKGAKHLRNPAADIPFYQYYLLDVIGFLVAVTVAAISLVVFITKRIYRLIRSHISNNSLLAKKVN